MITADFIECFDAKALNMDGSNFLCHTAQRVSSADSAAWAAWASVLVTTIALILAAFAWRESKEANRKAADKLALDLRSVESQIKAQVDLSFRESELEQFRLYSEKLISFANETPVLRQELTALMRNIEVDEEQANTAQHLSDREFEGAKGELGIRWASWAMYLIREDKDLRNATSRWQTKLIDLAESIRSEANAFYMIQIKDSNLNERRSRLASIGANHEHLLDEVARYVAILQELEATPEKSARLREHLLNSLPGPAPSKVAT